MKESPRNACGIGLSCPQSILGTVGHNIWPPAVAPKEHRSPIMSVLHLPVPCRCPGTDRPLGVDIWTTLSPRVRVDWDDPERDLPNKPDSAQKEGGSED